MAEEQSKGIQQIEGCEVIYDMGSGLVIAKVPLDKVKEQDINARIMMDQMQDQLTANIKKRGQLESLPLFVLIDGKLEIISGHHRVKSARAAEMKEIVAMVDVSGLSRSKIAAKQLAHNAISGFDDGSTLREIVKMIDDVDDMIESFVGKEIMEEPMKQYNKMLSPAVQFDFKNVTFTFLPHQVNDMDILVKDLESKAPEIDAAGFDAEEEWTYLAKVFGSNAIPADAAEVIKQAIKKAEKEGTITSKNRWQLIEYLCADYLGK